MKKFTYKLLLILGLAVLLRFPFLSTFPPSMVQDEVGLGYTSISIAETGKDEWGISYPLVFKSFGDYKPPAFFYTTALLYKAIGWQTVLPRVTSAIAGVFIVLLGSLWIRKILKSDELGLVAGFILAVSPWTIHLSRMALESNLGLAFFMAGLLFMADAKKSFLKLFASGLFFSLSTYSYHGFRFTIILFLVALLFITTILNLKKLKIVKPSLKTIFAILAISTLLSIPGFLSKGATNRLDQTLKITSKKTLYIYNHYENNCHVTLVKINPKLSKVCKLKYNKFTKPVLITFSSLTKHISPAFLFFSGDQDPGRNPVGQGEFYLVLFPMWMIGIIALFKKSKLKNINESNLLIITGYFISILPSTFAGDPHSIRMSVHIPFVVAVIVIGYKYLKSKAKYFSLLFISLLLLSTGLFIINYVSDTYAEHEKTSTFLSYAKTVAKTSHDYIQKGYIVYSDYDLYPEPHIYYAYWNKIDPIVMQKSFADVIQEDSGFSRPTKLGDNLFFSRGNIGEMVCNPEYTKKTVFITNDPVKLPFVDTITDTIGMHKFAYIYELEASRSNETDLLNFCNH